MTAIIPKHIVLYADDDEDDQDFVKTVLTSTIEDLELISVWNGLQAIEYLETLKGKSEKLCLIILDINMPKMNGKEALLRIKEMSHLEKVPVVMFSTSTLPSDRKFAYENGAAYIIKPIDYTQIKFLADVFIEHCTDEVKGNLRKKD